MRHHIFFNYSRINAGLSNPKVKRHMEALFGEERATKLATLLKPLTPAAREATIIEELARALKAYGHQYVLPFCFKNESGKRTTHHLVLVTKHFKGYDVMKGIMANVSTSAHQGVPSFVFSPADSPAQQLLFELNRPLDDLQKQLVEDFAGRQLTVRELYETHSVDRPYILRNYKSVLLEMETQHLISCDPPCPPRRKNTMADKTTVRFL